MGTGYRLRTAFVPLPLPPPILPELRPPNPNPLVFPLPSRKAGILSGSMRSFSLFFFTSFARTCSFWSARKIGGGTDNDGVAVIPAGLGNEN